MFHEAGEKFGKSFKAVYDLGSLVKNAGFEDVHEAWYKVPVGGWSSDKHLKELGRWNLLHCTQGAEGWGLFLLTNIMKVSVEVIRMSVILLTVKSGRRRKRRSSLPSSGKA